jgi:hypothetical protein
VRRGMEFARLFEVRAQCEGPLRCQLWQDWGAHWAFPGSFARVLKTTGRKSPGAEAESATPEGKDPRALLHLWRTAAGQLAIITVM